MPELLTQILTQILTIPNVIFCLAIFALVWVQRKAIELAFPQILTKKWWTELLVPAGPLGTGALLAALISSYPYPDMFKGTWSARAIFGIFCGLVCGFLYRVLKKNVVEKLLGGTVSSDDLDKIN